MKKLLTLFIFLVFNNSIYSQYDFYVGIGSMANFGELGGILQNESITSYSFFANGQASYSKSILKFNLNIQWYQSLWKQRAYSPAVKPNLNRISYFSLNPTMEIKPTKTFGIHFGIYGAGNVGEAWFDHDSGAWRSSLLGIPSYKAYDYGLSGGISFYIKEKLSINFQYLHGFENILRELNFGDFGNQGALMYNRALQVGGAYIIE